MGPRRIRRATAGRLARENDGRMTEPISPRPGRGGADAKHGNQDPVAPERRAGPGRVRKLGTERSKAHPSARAPMRHPGQSRVRGQPDIADEPGCGRLSRCESSFIVFLAHHQGRKRPRQGRSEDLTKPSNRGGGGGERTRSNPDQTASPARSDGVSDHGVGRKARVRVEHDGAHPRTGVDRARLKGGGCACCGLWQHITEPTKASGTGTAESPANAVSAPGKGHAQWDETHRSSQARTRPLRERLPGFSASLRKVGSPLSRWEGRAASLKVREVGVHAAGCGSTSRNRQKQAVRGPQSRQRMPFQLRGKDTHNGTKPAGPPRLEPDL
ncbi:UNVERIFIED_CONTAM: hypothetical protein FKN15_066506 [Acipenser sinensis]